MQLQIPEGDFGGYIFDLDGTLVDTMPIHYLAWEAALAKTGLKGRLDEDYFYELGGVPSSKVAALLGKHHGLKLDPGWPSTGTRRRSSRARSRSSS